MTAQDQDTAPTPTVRELFHPSFPDIPWPVREKHDFQAYVPTATDYHFRPDITADYLGWLNFGGLSALISGPTGSGKSSIVNEVAARSNVPVFPVVGHHRLEWIDLSGSYVPTESGGFSFEYGPLPLAMKSGGILLFDEIDQVDPSTLVAMNNILDGRPFVLSANNGEIIHPQGGFRIIATANTTGHGDGEAYGYAGTVRMSRAFTNRLQWTFIVNYPEHEVEVALLTEILGNEDIASQMVKFATEVRNLHTSEESYLQDTVSTRELREWAKAALFFQKVPRVKNPLAQALKYVVVHKASNEGRPILNEVFQRLFDAEL